VGNEEIRSKVWRKGKVVEENFEFERLSDFLADDSCVVWMDVTSPDNKMLQALANELSLDQNAVEDAVEARERPKLTHYADYKFLTAYSVSLTAEDPTIKLGRVSAFVMPNALVTVRADHDFDMGPVLKRWDDTGELVEHGVGALMHGLLDVIVDGHFDAVQILDDALESLEDDLFEEKPQTKQVQRHSFELRKSLVRLRRVVLPMREVVGGMQRHDDTKHHWDPELDSYFQDLYDHVLRASEWTESLRDMISTIFETNLSLSDTRMNVVMKKLTSWAAIIAVPTAITGFYGQNVPYPGFNQHSGFYASTAVIVVLVVGLYVGFRRKDWL
jgi:magnesium transporter